MAYLLRHNVGWRTIINSDSDPHPNRIGHALIAREALPVITNTLLQLPPDQLTQQGVNAAIRKIKNFKTDILCTPWYFGDLPYHVPNNVDRTVVPQNRVMVQKEDCFPIAAFDSNNLVAIRAAEVAQSLNR